MGLTLAPPAGAATFDIPCGDVTGLKNAIVHANATPTTPSTINLARRCPYTLRVRFDSTTDGLPPVSSPITLNGNGSTVARAGDAPSFRILEVATHGNLRVNGLIVTGGHGPNGGGLANSGVLTIVGSRVTGNVSDTEGAGILNRASGRATLTATEVNRNSAVSTSAVTSGGGIENKGALRVTSSQVNGNLARSTADSAIGAGIDVELNATVSLLSSQVNDNTADSPGNFAGGAGIDTVGTVALESSQVDGNRAMSAKGTASGAGVRSVGRLVTLDTSEVDGNTSSSPGAGAGGIYTGGDFTINRSHVDGNTAHNTSSSPMFGANGGGIFANFSMTLRGSTVRGNVAGRNGHGGGIFVNGAAKVMLFTTLPTMNTPDNCFPPGSVPGCTG